MAKTNSIAKAHITLTVEATSKFAIFYTLLITINKRMQTEKTKSKGNAKTKAKPERDMARVKAGQYSLYNLPLNEHSRIVFNWSVAMIE